MQPRTGSTELRDRSFTLMVFHRMHDDLTPFKGYFSFWSAVSEGLDPVGVVSCDLTLWIGIFSLRRSFHQPYSPFSPPSIFSLTINGRLSPFPRIL